MSLQQCNQEVFRKGRPLMFVSTGEVGGAAVFERWVQQLQAACGQRVDWHYSGGVAQVLVLGDWERAQHAAKSHPLPDTMAVLRWCEPTDAGLYRRGVTDAPEGAVTGFYDGGSESAYLIDDSEKEKS